MCQEAGWKPGLPTRLRKDFPVQGLFRAPRPCTPACQGKGWDPLWLRDPDHRLVWQPRPWARLTEAEVRPAALEPSSHSGLGLSGS